MNSSKNKKLQFILIIVVLVLLGLTAVIALSFIGKAKKTENISEDLADEFTRARWFIVDWYDELKGSGSCQVYLNELQIAGGKYTLTTANNRLRALYPRGERFFKLDQISKVEFLMIDGVIRCRFSYGENGEYMFRIG